VIKILTLLLLYKPESDKMVIFFIRRGGGIRRGAGALQGETLRVNPSR
jgi:hypothetical protein